jgi:hypothetical protein
VKKQVGTRTRRSVKQVRKESKYTETDTALELVEVYEAVERVYRAAIMASQTGAGIADSTKY